jgi:transposase
MQHTFDRWDELGNYMLNGLLEIDWAAYRNNLVENAIRPVAMGRKNYLFAGTLTNLLKGTPSRTHL